MAALDLTGMKFNRLTALRRAEKNTNAGKAVWVCECECGTALNVTSGHLKSGHTKSCGCAKVERSKKAKYIWHGHKSGGKASPTYGIWRGMLSRCTNKKLKIYKNYGGRGISVCERWHKFENFLSDMGERPAGLEIDRIDNNGNYEPSNCRWVTSKENNNNKRSNCPFEFNGRILNVSQWAEETGINKHTLRDRILQGWPPEKVFKAVR